MGLPDGDGLPDDGLPDGDGLLPVDVVLPPEVVVLEIVVVPDVEAVAEDEFAAVEPLVDVEVDPASVQTDGLMPMHDQPASTAHVALHPSPATVLLSSQPSSDAFRPSPHKDEHD